MNKRKVVVLVILIFGLFILSFLYSWQTNSATFQPDSILTTNGHKFSELERIDSEFSSQYKKIHPNCSSSQPAPEEANCTRYLWTRMITDTQLNGLFPLTNFYLIALRQITNPENSVSGSYATNRVLAFHKNRRLEAKQFQLLLDEYNLSIDDGNRQTVAEAFALMTAGNLLEDGLQFVSWEGVNYTKGNARHPYNYALSAQATGFSEDVMWFFVFSNDQLQIATVPKSIQPTASLIDYYFGK